MNRSIFQWHSLKTKISVATLAIFIAGLWSLSFYAIQTLRGDMKRQLGEQQFSTVSMLADHLDRELENRLRVLEVVATAAEKVAQEGQLAAVQAFIEQRLALLTMFNGGLIIVDSSGTAIADFPASTGRVGINYMDADVVAQTLREGKTGIGRPILGKKLNSPVVGIAAPIHDSGGKTIGAFVGIINLGLPNFIDQVTENRYGKTGGYLLIAPQHKLIVTSTDKKRIMQATSPPGRSSVIDRFLAGYEESAVHVNPFGVEMLSSAKRIPAADWVIVADLPTAEAFAPIRDMQKNMLIATILLTLLAGILTFWVLRRQLFPLLDAARALAGMSGANQPMHPLVVARQDEIGQLVGAFNGLLENLGQRESMLKQIFDTSSVAIFLVDIDGRITQANQRMAEMFGRPLEDLVGSEYVSLVHPSERDIGRQKMLALLASKSPSVDFDRLYLRADQTVFWGHLTGRRFYAADGSERGLIGVIADINVRKLAEEKLQLAASVFTHAREGILITAADGTIIDVNDSFERITGYTRDEILGRNPRLLKSGHHEPEFYAAMWSDLVEKGSWYGEIWNRRKNGEVYAEMKTISAVRDEKGVTRQFVALFSDITPLKAHEKQLEHMAHYDVLTTLPNRVLLADRLHQAIAQAQRHAQLLAVAYLDLDGFKSINDTYGHKTGDQLLIALASRMKHSLREGDTLARLGGDEFVAVLHDLPDVASSVPMVTRLLAAAAQPVDIGDLALQVSASIGLTFYPQADDVDADQLLRQADQAMYQAKVSGKNRYHIFDAAQDRSVRGYHEGLHLIRRALTDREFVLYYQPKVNMRSGAVIGAEALIRWQHPEKGLLPPAAFLPVIENHVLAVDIGEWVIDAALTQIELWRSVGLNISVSVNVGARQLQQPDFVERLREALARHVTIRPGDLEMEVLETSALEDLIRISQIIKECQALGVVFALDDFGTGYSSLTYLKRLPVSVLKIDQSFVRDMLDDTDDLTILEGVISLATAFRRTVIAEGVETVEHGEMLLQLGCELAQGYGIARPMPAAEMPGWVIAWQPDPAWRNRASVKREDLPLLFAGVEHRAWIAALEKHLDDNRSNAAPPLDRHQCRFGTWLDSDGLAYHGAHADFPAVERIHRQVHELAIELCEFQARGESVEVLARLGELHGLRDALLAQLQGLARDSFEDRPASQ